MILPPSGRGLSVRNPINSIYLLLNGHQYFWILALLVIAGEIFLTELIIRLVPYTEIDWETYMAQTEVFLKGQHNYSMITGPTGPLVYPAGHLRIHVALHDVTDSGTNIRLAQHIYAALYVVTFAFTCAIYRKAATIPNWVLLILPLSKRLHSIFVLRLFNDCWAVLAMNVAIFCYQLGLDDIGTIFFSAALSVKMSILLYFPGLLVILFQRRGFLSTLRHVMTILSVQILLANPFLSTDTFAYVNSAFDLSRAFLYKWTVNWRMIDEATFLSQRWAMGLLVGHVSVLILFGAYKWCNRDGGVWSILLRGLRYPWGPPAVTPLTADYVASVLFTSNLIGIIFARSLHYQFYSWYAQQVPFLAWKSPYPLVIRFALVLAVEYSWNVFPSTSSSSSVLLGANLLLLLGMWLGKDAAIGDVEAKDIPKEQP